jgi:hypothetical protein
MLQLILSAVICFFLTSTLIAKTIEEQTYQPDSVEVLLPEDCTKCNITDMEGPKERVHHQGKFYDDQTLRLLKEHARFNPNAPAGTLVEEAKLQKAAPPLRASFDGLNQITALNFNPPDTQIAVGPNHILQATNGGIRLSSKTNTNVTIVSWNVFFAKPGVFLFDPKLFFDPIGQRFFVTIIEKKNQPQVSVVRFAVSQSSSPASLTQGWCRYSYSGKVQGSWADYPSMGMNEKWFAIHTNNFKFSDNMFTRSLVKVADKSRLVNNATTCPSITFSTFNYPFPSSGISGTIQFGQTATTTSLAGTPLFAASTSAGDNTYYDLWRVVGTGNPSIIRNRLTARPYTAPPDAKHKSTGTDYDTDFPRTLSAVVRNGVITFSFTTGCNFGSLPNESCIRVVQISPTDSGGTVLFEGDFGAGADKFFWMPAVTVNSAGDLAVIFQQSGKTSFLGTAYTGKKSSASNLEPFKNLQIGKCNLVDDDGVGRNRTGDYAGITVDPSDNRTFWGSAEYSTNMNGRCVWSTRIGKMSY